MAELEIRLPADLREQQRSLGRVLRAVARGEGLQPVLDQLIEEASRLCAGEYGELHLVEGDVVRAFSYYVAVDGDSPIAQGALEQWELGRNNPHARDRSTLAGRVALLEDVVNIPDMVADSDYTFPLPAGTRAGLGVPILLDDDLIGTIGIVRDVRSPFTEDDVELVKTFADQAAIAIANARLLEALQRQLEQQRAIGDTLRAVARREGIQPVLDQILASATRLCEAENGRMWLAESDQLHAVANAGVEEGFEFDRANPHKFDDSSASGRAALTRTVVHIEDIDADPAYSYAGPRPYRANLSVPIQLEDELIGVIGMTRSEPRSFAKEQVALVETFADQAAIAITNARLIEAVERQLDQQRAISDVLQAIALSEGLEAVFEAVVAAATRLCHADFGALYLRDGDLFHLSTRHEWAPELDEFEREHPHVIDRTSAIGRVALTGDVVHIPDVADDPEYEWGGRDVSEYHAVLAAPVTVEGDLIGALDVTRRDPGPFAEEEVRLIRTFADQAAIAIANARLLETTNRQLEQQRAIGDVLQAIALSEGLERVFEIVIDAATRLCAGEYGSLHMLTADELPAVAHSGSFVQWEYDRDHAHVADRTTIVGRAAVTRTPVHIPDVASDPEYDYAGPREGFRAALGVPILLEGELIGVLGIVRREAGGFSDEQIELVKTFADQAAIAIGNARLLDAVERQRTELSRFVSPQVAELISSEDGDRMLAGHRAYVTSMFCDLRGFTSFTETAEPEELFEVLQDYHSALGELIRRYQGTLEHFAGDGLLVFFNDPLPVEDHELKAVELALAAQERFDELAAFWRKRGHELGLGIGIAAGYATLGRIGFEGRYDYGVLGTVTNLASRLSTQAELGQTLISQRVFAAVEERVDAHEVGALELKGFGRPVPAYEVRGLR